MLHIIYYEVLSGIPASTNHWNNICTTSAQRLQRWSNIVQMSYKCLVFAGIVCPPGVCDCMAWGGGGNKGELDCDVIVTNVITSITNTITTRECLCLLHRDLLCAGARISKSFPWWYGVPSHIRGLDILESASISIFTLDRNGNMIQKNRIVEGVHIFRPKCVFFTCILLLPSSY